MMLPQEIIRIKRNGQTLNDSQINSFVNGLVDGSFSDSQVGAMAMAIFQKGMSVMLLLLINILRVVLVIK